MMRAGGAGCCELLALAPLPITPPRLGLPLSPAPPSPYPQVSEVLSLSLSMQGIFRPPHLCKQRFRQITVRPDHRV